MKYFLLLSILLLNACASTGDRANGLPQAKQLISYAKSLIGTPYKYGGKSPKTGFDCSGYVGHVFEKMAGVSLPRSAQQISRHGQPVKSSQLREGDLVFYNTNNQAYSHVGIYLGNDRFIHAPSNGGRVRIEDMQKSYWKKHYNGARRVTLKR